MSSPKIVSQEEWDAARILLEKEKELTRQPRPAQHRAPRALPMVEVTKPYEFEGPGGTRSLLDLFHGRPQPIVYHFMFHPEWDDGVLQLLRRHRRVVARLHRAPPDEGHLVCPRVPRPTGQT